LSEKQRSLIFEYQSKMFAADQKI